MAEIENLVLKNKENRVSSESSDAPESLLSLKDILSAVDGKEISGKSADAFFFTNVQTDSRNVVKGSLFVPLVGENQDGHKFAGEAADKGASAIFINFSEYEKNSSCYEELCRKHKNLFVIAVGNTLEALQKSAGKYVEKFPFIRKIAVSGSSGKTTTKEMIVSVLKEKFNVVSTEGNFNSETGLPLSVFNIRKEHEVCVFEMGMNRFHEIEEISSVLKANYAVITNIGSAHIGILGSRENIAEEKKHIFDFIEDDGAAFIPFEDDFRDFLSENVKGEIVYYGKNVPSSESGVVFLCDRGVLGTSFSLFGLEVNLKIPGVYNYLNALAAVAVGKKFGLSPLQIKNGLEKMNSVSGRMETSRISLKNGKKITLVKDCYNANPDSMKSALSFVSSLDKKDEDSAEGSLENSVENSRESSGGKNDFCGVNKKICVLGDMLELGDESFSSHSEVGSLVSSLPLDFVFFVGNEMKAAFDKASLLGLSEAFYEEKHNMDSLEKISGLLLEKLSENDVLLLKASRGIALERLVPLIESSDKETGKKEKN